MNGRRETKRHSDLVRGISRSGDQQELLNSEPQLNRLEKIKKKPQKKFNTKSQQDTALRSMISIVSSLRTMRKKKRKKRRKNLMIPGVKNLRRSRQILSLKSQRVAKDERRKLVKIAGKLKSLQQLNHKSLRWECFHSSCFPSAVLASHKWLRRDRISQL